VHACHVQSDAGIPRTFQKAMKSPLAAAWKDACDDEISRMNVLDVLDLVALPPGRSAIPSFWVLATSRDADGNLARHKARLVADGSKQSFGVDYDSVFAPTYRLTSLRLLLSIAAAQDLKILQLDVKTAFLHGELMEEIYVRQPPGYGDGTVRVWRLKKSLYGLKQAARAWHAKLKEAFSSVGLFPLRSDTSVFSGVIAGSQLYALAYADDVLLVGSALAISQVYESLSKRFELSHAAPVSQFLGISVSRVRELGLLEISKSRYIEEILSRFNMEHSNPIRTPRPMPLGWKFVEPGTNLKETVPYAELVGSLLYLSQSTRPDIAHVVGVLSRYMSAPKFEH
jgi:hypothetical protein